ncbi:MAG: glycyl radical protein [Candidatus Cloacimonetes bacterium]|nr:glycyl radical protein [Candidatus Cloacimonadota bacterium]
MTDRIKRLREKSQYAVNRISAERALLVTKFYQQPETAELPIPVQRARCLAYILAHKKLYLGEGELLVGERGPEPRATPTYPEICLHTLKDLKILDDREKVSFKVDKETRDIYEKTVIPFWQGRTMRERIFAAMSPEWLRSYEAGMFTEFQEQRAPGHTVLGDKIYHQGMLDLIGQINAILAESSDWQDSSRKSRIEELQAMIIAAQAIIKYAVRYSEHLMAAADQEEDSRRKAELARMSGICRHVPAHAPRTFQEALQYYWFVHLGVITELNPWDSFNPGRLDQHLYPFYKKDIKTGVLNREEAIELLQAFWIKFNNHPSPPKVGVTAQESNTYTDFALINIGGLTEDGKDVSNELSFILLDVIEEMRLLQPSSMVQISTASPDSLLERALKIIKTGYGQPSIFNADAIVRELLRQGKTLADARNGGSSGCVETGAFGRESYILTGYFNLTKILEVTLNNGYDPCNGRQVGIRTGDPCKWENIEELWQAYHLQLQYFIDIKLKGNDIIENLYANNLPAPFLSLLIDDCMVRGRDYNARGARYNTSYIQGVGLGSITDSITSIAYNVFDEGKVSMNVLLQALNSNFTGSEELHCDLIHATPKYGNDNEYADRTALKVFNCFFQAVEGRKSPLGADYRINMLPTTCHVYFGQVTGATPDGRKAGMPLSEGISPVQGADRLGPTAVLKSAAVIDHLRTGGTLLNQKFSPDFFKDEESIARLVKLIRSYFTMMGHHIQFNVVSASLLLQAQKYPERYGDLIVRVAGYSDYFNNLGRELQDEIIRRTEHSGD